MESVAKTAGTARGTAEEGPAEEVRDGLSSALAVYTEKVRGHLDEVVRSTVAQTLNQLLDEEVLPGVDRLEHRNDLSAAALRHHSHFAPEAGQSAASVRSIDEPTPLHLIGGGWSRSLLSPQPSASPL